MADPSSSTFSFFTSIYLHLYVFFLFFVLHCMFIVTSKATIFSSKKLWFLGYDATKYWFFFSALYICGWVLFFLCIWCSGSLSSRPVFCDFGLIIFESCLIWVRSFWNLVWVVRSRVGLFDSVRIVIFVHRSRWIWKDLGLGFSEIGAFVVSLDFFGEISIPWVIRVLLFDYIQLEALIVRFSRVP